MAGPREEHVDLMAWCAFSTPVDPRGVPLPFFRGARGNP